MPDITFDLTLDNVKEIVCETDIISLKLDKVVDINGNILWQRGNKAIFINIWFYNIYGEKTPIDTVFCGGYFKAAYQLVDASSNVLLFDDSDNTNLIRVLFFFVDSNGSQILNYDDYIDYAYAGYKYGVNLTFDGGTVNNVNYLEASASYILPKAIYSDKGIPTEIIRNSSNIFVATCVSPIMQQSTSTDWDWIITAHSATSAEFKRIKHSEVFSYTSNLTFAEFKTGVEDFHKNNGGIVASDFIIGPWFLTAEARSNITYIPEGEEDPEPYVENFRYSKMLFYPVEWTSSSFSYDDDEDYTDIIVYLDSSYRASIHAMLTYSYEPGTSFYVKGKYSLYANDVQVQNNIEFSTLETVPPNESKFKTLTTGEAIIVSDGSNNPYLRIGTGVHNLNFGQTYKTVLTIDETPFVKYSNTFSKLLRPFIYKWGTSSNGGTEPELCLGSSINSWPSTTSSSNRLSNYVYLAVYDHPDDSATTDMTFSGKIQLYKNGSYYTTMSFSAVKPNQYGNLILTTDLQYDPNVDYKAILTIDPGYRNGFAGLASYEVTNGNANMRGTYVDVSSVSGASVTYISDTSTTSGYGARIFFSSYATYTVRVRMRRRAIGETAWSDWRVYSIFVNDGNKSWTDKATMLIDTTDVTTAAWYYKSGYSYGVEIGLTKGYEYQLTSITNDDTSYYSNNLITATNLSHVYTGAAITGYSNSSVWTVTPNFTGSMITVGSYPYTLTKTAPLKIWSDDYTRLKTDKTAIYTITKAYWSVSDTSADHNILTNNSTYWGQDNYGNYEVKLRIFDYPNREGNKSADLPYVSWKLYGYEAGHLTGSQIISQGRLLASGSGYVKYNDYSTDMAIAADSGNMLIGTGYTGESTKKMDVRGVITINSTNNMQPVSTTMYTAVYTTDSKYTLVNKPSATTSFTYDGSSHMAFSSGTGYTASGSGTNAGSHTTTATLKSGYCWSDGSTDPYTVYFTINKASVSILDSIKFRKNGTSYEYWIDLASYARNNSFTVEKKRYDSASTSKPSDHTSASETVTANSNGNLVGTFKPKKTYVWLDVTVTPSGSNSNFTGSDSAKSGRRRVSSITTSWS